jgi:hypothetical protein
MTTVPTVTNHTEDGPVVVWRLAGVLALAVGAIIVFWMLWALVSGNFLSRDALYLVQAALAIAGGVLALLGKRAIAPWLILAASLVGWAIDLALGFGFIWPWEPLMWAGDSFDYFGPLGGLLGTLAALANWLLLLAAVLAIVAFATSSGSPKATPTAAAQANISQGVATIREDGTVAAGWYADPDGKPAERYWNGNTWTEQSRPMTTMTAPVYTGVVAKPTVTPAGEPISPSSRAAAAILCFVVGVLGIHRFYVGKIGTGVVMLLTLGGLGIWALVDFIWILVGTFKDKSGRVLANW